MRVNCCKIKIVKHLNYEQLSSLPKRIANQEREKLKARSFFKSWQNHYLVISFFLNNLNLEKLANNLSLFKYTIG